jgi:hypothetical protein
MDVPYVDYVKVWLVHVMQSSVQSIWLASYERLSLSFISLVSVTVLLMDA